jgi:2,3-bisphosphoglycerate-independent phosphoglycerate mutase
MNSNIPSPIILIILDGFGYREETNANAIAAAQTPTWDHILENYPHTLISGSGSCVGLPAGQMGNSEVGHLNMGAGRIVSQDLTRIDSDIENEQFYENSVLVNACLKAQQTQKKLHLFGLLSPGGVHSHETHIQSALKLAAKRGLSDVYLHAFLDGRDTPPQSALASLQAIETLCQELQCGQIASIIGRYYAMDRDQRWDRIQKAYELLTEGKATYQASNAQEALKMAYERGETDEFVQATRIQKQHSNAITIDDGDIVIFMNFRADRARELTQAFIEPDFHGFSRIKNPTLGEFACLTEYHKEFKTPIAYPVAPLKNIFAEYVSHFGLKQLRIAETEKYAHVTFFFNGGVEKPYPGEDRILIPSPKVATYDLQPEMSAYELTNRLISEIKNNSYDVIICNFANPDMVGHTGNLNATIKAIETIDHCLKQLVETTKEINGEILITADHGNAEMLFDPLTNQPHTAHTSELVPFVYIGRKATISKKNGKLSDISPTLLYLLGLEIPKEMSGSSLVKLV